MKISINKQDAFHAFLMFIAVSSGLIALGRFSSADSVLSRIEFRELATAGLVASLLFNLYNKTEFGQFNYRAIFIFAFAVLSALSLSLYTNTINLKFYNYLFLFLIVFLTYFCLNSERRLVYFMFLSCVLGALLLLLASLWGISNADLNGPGLSAIGGPLTTGRLEFFAAAGALLLMGLVPSRLWWAQVLGTALVAMFMFGCLASLQKGITIAFVAIVPLMIAAYLLTGHYRLALITLCATAMASGVWFFASAGHFNDRLAAAMSALDEADPKYHNTGLGELSLQARYCYVSPGTGVTQTDTCTESAMLDRTGRLAMAMRAIEGIKSHPILGNGFASFELILRNRYTKQPETYTYPHNVVLEVLHETGFIGLGFFAAAGLWFTIAAVRSPMPQRLKIPLFGIAGLMLVSMQVSGDMYDSRMFWVVLCAMAAYRPTLPARAPLHVAA